jgi:hypothetical protein
LGQPICDTLYTVIVQDALFGQVYREDLLNAALFIPLIIVLIGLLWAVVGAQLLGYGIFHRNPHAPAYGLTLVLLTVGLLLASIWLLEQSARPWLVQQNANLSAQTVVESTALNTETPEEPNDNSSVLAQQTELIARYHQVISVTQTMSALAAFVISGIGIGLFFPYPNLPIISSTAHQCATCGVMGDAERPRCILCHAPLALDIPPDAQIIAVQSGKTFEVRLSLQPEAQNGLPVRNPNLQLVIPSRFTLKSVQSSGMTHWTFKPRRLGSHTITGPDYLTRLVTLTLTIEAAPRFQVMRQRASTLYFSAIASQGVTANGAVKVRVQRTRLIDRIPVRVKRIPANLFIILSNLYRAARNLLTGLIQLLRRIITVSGNLWRAVRTGTARLDWRLIGRFGTNLKNGFARLFHAIQGGASGLSTRTQAWRERQAPQAPKSSKPTVIDSARPAESQDEPSLRGGEFSIPFMNEDDGGDVGDTAASNDDREGRPS